MRKAGNVLWVLLSDGGSQRHAGDQASCGEIWTSCRRSEGAFDALRSWFHCLEKSVVWNLGGV